MARESLRLGFKQLKDEWPIAIFVFGDLIPETLRVIVFCLIGRIVGGEAGFEFAWLGCIALVVANTCVAHTTDIPATDARSGTIGILSRAPLGLLGQYLLRALPLSLLAAVKVLVVALLLGSLFGFSDTLPSVLSSLWVIIPAIASSTLFSFAALAPTLGTGWEHLSYNLATAVLTVTSGAVVALDSVPGVGIVGGFLPLHHSIDALRNLASGDPDIAAAFVSVGLELGVGALWFMVASAFFKYRLRRDWLTGQGGFDL